MGNGEQEHQVPTEMVGWVENSNNFKNETLKHNGKKGGHIYVNVTLN